MNQDIRVFKIDPKSGRRTGSRSTGRGWYARLADGRWLTTNERRGWPPYPVIALVVQPPPLKRKRDALDLAKRFVHDP